MLLYGRCLNKRRYLSSCIAVYSGRNVMPYFTVTLSKSAKLVRWWVALQAFHVEVMHR